MSNQTVVARIKEDQQLFLKSLQEVGAINRAAQAVGLQRSMVYRWINSDPEFAARVEEHRQIKIENLEESLYQQAMSGNTTAGIFLLKSARPDVYCDRARAEALARPQPVTQQTGKLADQMYFGGKEPAIAREEYFYRVKIDFLNAGVRLEGEWDDIESHYAVILATGERKKVYVDLACRPNNSFLPK